MSSCGDSLGGGGLVKCKIKMSKFCAYDELECLQEYNNFVRFSGVSKSTFGEKDSVVMTGQRSIFGEIDVFFNFNSRLVVYFFTLGQHLT